MSLYPQNYYGHPTYPTAQPGYPYGYQQAPPSAPHPPPIIHDPMVFRRDYATRLQSLTVNSRPIIQNLSMLAQYYSRFAEIVAQCLEAHIRRVPPWMKLPPFYLLDAISKNVFDPYARQFAPVVTNLFLDTYREVDDATRNKMEEMLLTWRTGSPVGKELFGVPTQIAIERGVWGDPNAQYSNSFHAGAGHITKAQVLSELEFALNQKERTLQNNPYDTLAQKHIAILQQLRPHVEAGVSPAELEQILNQLRALVRTAPMSVPPQTPATIPSVPPVHWPSQTSYVNQPVSQTYPAQGQSYPPSQHLPPGLVGSNSSTPAAVPGPSKTPNNIGDLLSTLIKAGIVSATGTPNSTGASSNDNSGSAQSQREASRPYRQTVISYKIALNGVDILKQRPPIAELLLANQPSQCRQCGVRFSSSEAGKRAMDDHLDMHFRQNRKASQNTGRGHSRSWFTLVEDWVNNDRTDVKGKGRADGNRSVNSKADMVKRDAELRAQYVIVPPGDEAKQIACPICKELLKSEFLEDEEEWVWRNAIRKDERVYHATCHAEASASASSLVARLRTEMGNNRSRSGTPEVQSHRATPPPASVRQNLISPTQSPASDSKVAGTKRKVEHQEIASINEPGGTPPLKKLALSTALPLHLYFGNNRAAQYHYIFDRIVYTYFIQSINVFSFLINYHCVMFSAGTFSPLTINNVSDNVPVIEFAAAGGQHNTYFWATLQRIDELANEDIEMQAPLTENSLFVVLDTNIVLHQFEAITQFVDDIERLSLSVVVVIPGIVIYELDGQKNREDLAWVARRASSWLLKKVKERKTVKGQANDETCKPSKNWKTRTADELYTGRVNDGLILDCCKYFMKQRLTYLCSADNNLCFEADTTGILSLTPTPDWCSREIARALYGDLVDLNKFGTYRVSYKSPNGVALAGAKRVAPVFSDDDMHVDDDGAVAELLLPTHALDLFHVQVIDHFTPVLIELVGRVGGSRLRTSGVAVSQYAPEWLQRLGRKHYTEWSCADCLLYLVHEKPMPVTNPRLEIFLSKPYSRAGARRGQDWSRRDWDVSLGGLKRLGREWQEGGIGEAVGVVAQHLQGIFAKQMRPTGT
ncbi:hypothetical protein AX16_001016 [Volvariella volvacea WC 439]|nr:hypothetical protein AX16_001016 [Volvariella volvacea WC 439]